MAFLWYHTLRKKIKMSKKDGGGIKMGKKRSQPRLEFKILFVHGEIFKCVLLETVFQEFISFFSLCWTAKSFTRYKLLETVYK